MSWCHPSWFRWWPHYQARYDSLAQILDRHGCWLACHAHKYQRCSWSGRSCNDSERARSTCVDYTYRCCKENAASQRSSSYGSEQTCRANCAIWVQWVAVDDRCCQRHQGCWCGDLFASSPDSCLQDCRCALLDAFVCQCPYKDEVYCRVAGSVHEILLVPATSRFNPKASNKTNNRQGRKAKTPKPHEAPLQEPVQVVTKQTREDQSRLDKLESKVSELENRQDKFERKFDQRLDGVDSALRQLLQRSEPARPRDAGETPPPKFPKNGWDAWGAPHSWILDFRCRLSSPFWTFLFIFAGALPLSCLRVPLGISCQLAALCPSVSAHLDLCSVAPSFGLDFLGVLDFALLDLWTFGCVARPLVPYALLTSSCPSLWRLPVESSLACWPFRVHLQALPRAYFEFWTYGFSCPHSSTLCFVLCVFGRFLLCCRRYTVARDILQFAISQLAAFCCISKFQENQTKSALVSLSATCPFIFMCCHCRMMMLPCRLLQFRFDVMNFDCTLGFPGEGPEQLNRKPFTLASQNIGSINTNHSWKRLNADVVCLQETRIGKNNDRQSNFLVAEMGSKLFRGKLLPGLLQKNGKHRVAHGGTAIIAPKQLTIPFDPKKDITNLYNKHFEANRCNACWVQVTRNIRLLVFSIYAITGASSDQKAHEKNDQMLADLFEVCSQFGDIPIVLAGDLQCEPLHYPSVSHAINFLHWTDPLMSVNDAGEMYRPLTYSNDGSFSGAEDRNSSIDALLLNKVAIAALRDIHVVEIDGLQHRPLRAIFDWHSITQVGFVHVKAAPIHCDNVQTPNSKPELCPLSSGAESIWEENFKASFSPDHSELAWEQINRFGIQILLQGGGQWGDGPRERGKPPKFIQKVVCPGQLSTGVVKTRPLHKLVCTLASLQELAHRLRRPSAKPADLHATRSLLKKARTRVLEHETLISWDRFTWPTLDVIENNILRLKEAIGQEEHRTKMNRISLWRQKMKVSATGNKAYIFHHLKTKASDDPPNLISDSAGNILFQPSEAIQEINSQWDDVFSANILRSDPIDILRVIWPYISHENHQQDDLDLAPADLFYTVQKRKAVAAPGLDGWRTHELQCLPVAFFVPVAQYFRALEQNAESLANTLTCAKQVILNKNGHADPMQKRLITIMPALTLAYTGTRFRQLQEWQSRSIPKTIYGGIKGRSMAAIATSLRLDVDDADANHDAIVGIKLDKSKCFDRIIPEYAASLFLCFGIPQGIVAIFLKIYRNLRRHMFYKQWSTPCSTTASNGVAQGCSFSLLAVNVYAKVWSCMLQKLPQVAHAGFIDDSYIWVRLCHLQVLQHALQVTELWDLLSGQQFNHGKSKLFATTSDARALAKSMFPSICCCFEIDILGTILYTSKRRVFCFSPDKVRKVIQDARNIAILPLPVEVKATLTGMKILPQCNFASGISRISKKDLGKIQAEIVNILWHGRPVWRAKWLVFALIGQPHRLEPTISRAFVAIVDFLRFIEENVDKHQTILTLLQVEQPSQHSLVSLFRQALQIFGFHVARDGMLFYKNIPQIPLVEACSADLKGALKILATDVCYQNANDLHRKDFSKTEGVFDPDLSKLVLRTMQNSSSHDVPDRQFLLNHMVGCSTTRDRLSAAGFIADSSCRFCQSEKESIPHIMKSCDPAKAFFGAVPDHELGANFVSLGLVEHPFGIAKHRFKLTTKLPEIPTQIDTSCKKCLWSDGSLQWSDIFWLQSGGFAIVDETSSIIAAGPIRHWHMSSYTVELWAIVVAFSTAKTGISIFTDCLQVVKHFAFCYRERKIPDNCKHAPWWYSILSVLNTFDARGEGFFAIHWIPGHVLEDVPCNMINHAMALAHNTTPLHITNNRIADHKAKEQAILAAAVHPEDREWLYSAIRETHERICCIGKRLGDDVVLSKQMSTEEHAPCEVTPALPSLDQVVQRFPMWLWRASDKDFPWRPRPTDHSTPPRKWSLQVQDWHDVCGFLSTCCWKCKPGLSTAFVELACLFTFRGFRFVDGDDPDTSFRVVLDKLRKAMCFLHQNKLGLFPGTWQRCVNKNHGKALPAGLIHGVIPMMSDLELGTIGRMLMSGAGKKLTSWAFSLTDVRDFLHFWWRCACFSLVHFDC